MVKALELGVALRKILTILNFRCAQETIFRILRHLKRWLENLNTISTPTLRSLIVA
jgi:hypothetical protein